MAILVVLKSLHMRCKVISWKPGYSCGVEAKEAHEEIERIRFDNGGCVSSAAIVDQSRDEKTPLHPAFEWDDYKAAERHRREQARHLVTAFRIETVASGEASAAPVYVSVVKEDVRGYMPIELVMEDRETAEFVIQEALNGLRVWQRRYESIEALSDAVSRVGRVIDGLE